MLSVQWEAFSNLSTNFDHCNLNNKSQKRNENENAVSENSRENVELTIFQKSGIELIEKLHENKDLEYIGEMKKFHCFCHIWNISWSNNMFGPVSSFLKLSTGKSILNMTLLINKATEII